jgi:hypothetical protein
MTHAPRAGIQQLVHERVQYVPLYALSYHNGVGPRVAESTLVASRSTTIRRRSRISASNRERV